jgi:hypothetical protein
MEALNLVCTQVNQLNSLCRLLCGNHQVWSLEKNLEKLGTSSLQILYLVGFPQSVGWLIALRRGDCPILRLALCVIKLRLFTISWSAVFSLVKYGLESSNFWVSALCRRNLQHLVSLNGGGRQYRQCPRLNGRVSTP